MAIEYIVGAGIVGFCAYMSYRGQQKVKKVNERVRNFQEDVEIAQSWGIPFDTRELAKRHNLVTLTAGFDNPGEFETEKVLQREDGSVERYVSNGKKWIRYE